MRKKVHHFGSKSVKNSTVQGGAGLKNSMHQTVFNFLAFLSPFCALFDVFWPVLFSLLYNFLFFKKKYTKERGGAGCRLGNEIPTGYFISVENLCLQAGTPAPRRFHRFGHQKRPNYGSFDTKGLKTLQFWPKWRCRLQIKPAPPHFGLASPQQSQLASPRLSSRRRSSPRLASAVEARLASPQQSKLASPRLSSRSSPQQSQLAEAVVARRSPSSICGLRCSVAAFADSEAPSQHSPTLRLAVAEAVVASRSIRSRQ